MSAAKPGEVWMTDLGLAAKVRPCLILTPPPGSGDLDVFTIIAHTTACRGSRWEIPISKPFLDREGAFDVQRVATVASVKLERKLGELTRSDWISSSIDWRTASACEIAVLAIPVLDFQHQSFSFEKYVARAEYLARMNRGAIAGHSRSAPEACQRPSRCGRLCS